MAAPRIDIIANKRVPFDDVIAAMGVDYSGATLVMEVRAEPGDTGNPILTMGMSVSGGQGLAVSYDANFPDPLGDLPDGASIVRIIINETSLEALQYGADPASPVIASYDIHLTPSGGKKLIFAQGRFIIHPGVTL